MMKKTSSLHNPSLCQAVLETIKTLNNTDVKYKICTFGSGFNIELGIQVIIKFGGRECEGKTHSSVKGRIGGLSCLYKENHFEVGMF